MSRTHIALAVGALAFGLWCLKQRSDSATAAQTNLDQNTGIVPVHRDPWSTPPAVPIHRDRADPASFARQVDPMAFLPRAVVK